MLEIYQTDEKGRIHKKDKITDNCWINVVTPDEEEMDKLVQETGVEMEFIIHSLDPEEKPRIDEENDQTLIIIDIPINIPDEYPEYSTIPLGIIIVDKLLITISNQDTSILNNFKKNRVKEFYIAKRTRFLFQIFYQVALTYLTFLKKINNKSEEIEQKLHLSLKNKELYSLLNLEKSLVYFTTSLKSNETVMEKILKYKPLEFYQEDEELIDDAIVENKQALEMANIYSNILSGMMDAFASVISNNLNMVMKFLAAITIILSIPTLVASFYGMNVLLPLQNRSDAFLIIIGLSIVISIIFTIILARKNML